MIFWIRSFLKAQIASSVWPDWPISGREGDGVLQASPRDTTVPTFRSAYQPEIIISQVLKKSSWKALKENLWSLTRKLVVTSYLPHLCPLGSPFSKQLGSVPSQWTRCRWCCRTSRSSSSIHRRSVNSWWQFEISLRRNENVCLNLESFTTNQERSFFILFFTMVVKRLCTAQSNSVEN